MNLAFTKSIAALGDLNGDGHIDLAVGTEDDTGGTNRVLFQAAPSAPGDFDFDGVADSADLARWKQAPPVDWVR